MNALINTIESNNDFYPTPPKLQQKMLSKIVDWRFVETVLEPSAGKGDLIKALKNKESHLDIDAIEIEPDLQTILKGNGCRLVHDDFLTYKTFKHYDLIFANFPFSNGARHLLKALQIQENGGAIVALVNAETLRNPYTNERKILHSKLVSHNAEMPEEDKAIIDEFQGKKEYEKVMRNKGVYLFEAEKTLMITDNV